MGENARLNLYRSCTPVVDVEYDRHGPNNIVETLIDALAKAEGVDVTAIPPVYDTIDLEAIRQLFEREDGATDTLLSFTFGDWNIFVRADGRIRVCDGTQHTDPAPVFEGAPV